MLLPTPQILGFLPLVQRIIMIAVKTMVAPAAVVAVAAAVMVVIK